MEINLNQSSNIFFFLHSNGPSYLPHNPLIMPVFQDCPNPGAGGPQLRCCKWFAPSGGPGKRLQAQGLLGTLSLEPSPSHSVEVYSAAHCWVLEILWWRKDWPAPCPHRAHSLVGRGTGSHYYHLGPWEGWGDKPKMTWRREEEIIGRMGRKLTQQATRMSVLLGDRVVVGKSLNRTTPLPLKPY